MSASNVVKNTAAAAVLAVAISMAFAAMAYADEPAGKAIESDAVTGVTSSDIAWGDAAASSAEAEDTRMILRAPGSGVDYSGYKLTVGLFDDGGNQVGGNYEVAYNGGPTTVEGLDPSKVYTARVLALVDADGNDALADFDNAVEESEKLVTGAEQEVWTKADALKPGMKGVALMFEHEGKTYMLGVDASNNVIAREATFENGVPTNVGDKFKWDTEPAQYDSVALSISGENNYLVMNYNGPAMHPANQFYNYEFATVNGALRGNGNYHIFI
ncbi:MAG: cell wall anchor protein, partial [Slackia sp.]|nr:cell wall anchor protein [Slackia sp.]